MGSRRQFSGKTLALIAAFAVLLIAAFGAGCSNFFVPNSLTAVTIQPTAPSIEVGQSETLQAWGTYEDNTRSQITSGVAWTSSDTTVLTIGTSTGLAQAVGGGTSTVTASAQGLSATATATAYYGTVSNFEICLGSFGATTSCSSGSSALSWTVPAGQSANFVAQGSIVTSGGQNQEVDLTTSATFTPSNSGITCDNSSSPAVCTVDSSTTPANYTIGVTYGTSSSATVNVTVTS